MIITLSWGACVKIALLIIFFHASKNVINKFQERYCPLCKVDTPGK